MKFEVRGALYLKGGHNVPDFFRRNNPFFLPAGGSSSGRRWMVLKRLPEEDPSRQDVLFLFRGGVRG
jgi:hypothetical protein